MTKLFMIYIRRIENLELDFVWLLFMFDEVFIVRKPGVEIIEVCFSRHSLLVTIL